MKTEFNKKKTILLLALAMMLVMTGCKKDAVDIIFGTGDDDKISYRYDDTIYLPMENIRSLNPLVSKDEDVFFISKLVYNGLFEPNENMEPVPVLASSYYYENDGRTLNLQLRSGVKFSDGSALTGEDVKFSVDAIRYAVKAGQSVYGPCIAGIKSVQVNKNDAMGLTIKFASEYDSGIENLTFPILPAHLFKNAAAVTGSDKNFKMVGTGPYKEENYREFATLTLSENEYYFGEKPGNKLVFQILPDRNYAVNMTQAGDISMFFGDADEKDSILSRYDLKVKTFLTNKAVAIGFNCSGEKLAKPQMRQALAYAIDAKELLKNGFYGNGLQTDSLFYPGFYGLEDEKDKYPKNNEKAGYLLKVQGYEDSDGDGFVDKSGENLTITVLTPGFDEQRVKAAGILAGQLKEAGIATEIVTASQEEFSAKLASRAYDIFLGELTFDEKYDMYSLLSGYVTGCGYSGEKLLALALEVEKGQDAELRREKIKEFKTVLASELPYYCLFYKEDACYMSDYFEGKVEPVFHDHLRNSGEWRCKYPENSEAN